MLQMIRIANSERLVLNIDSTAMSHVDIIFCIIHYPFVILYFIGIIILKDTQHPLRE